MTEERGVKIRDLTSKATIGVVLLFVAFVGGHAYGARDAAAKIETLKQQYERDLIRTTPAKAASNVVAPHDAGICISDKGIVGHRRSRATLEDVRRDWGLQGRFDRVVGAEKP